MQKLTYTWLHLVIPKEQCKESLYSHKNEKPVSFKREIHSIHLAFIIFEESHRSLTVRNLHCEGRRAMPLSSVCLLVHNKIEFQSWECFGARIFILSSPSSLHISNWRPLCLCCLAWSTMWCRPTVLTSSALRIRSHKSVQCYFKFSGLSWKAI